MLNPRRFDLWAWATYTVSDTQIVVMLLGSILPKLDRQHEKTWVLLGADIHTTYLLNSISLSPCPTPCPPLYLPPRYYLVLASTG